MDRRLDDLHDGFVVVRSRVDIDAEHFGQLGGGDDQGSGICEAVDNRVR